MIISYQSAVRSQFLNTCIALLPCKLKLRLGLLVGQFSSAHFTPTSKQSYVLSLCRLSVLVRAITCAIVANKHELMSFRISYVRSIYYSKQVTADKRKRRVIIKRGFFSRLLYIDDRHLVKKSTTRSFSAKRLPFVLTNRTTSATKNLNFKYKPNKTSFSHLLYGT